MATPEAAKKKAVPLLKQLWWVYEHIGDEDGETKRGDAPCSGAWYLLQNCRAHSRMKETLYESLFRMIRPEDVAEEFDAGKAEDQVLASLSRIEAEAVRALRTAENLGEKSERVSGVAEVAHGA